jgi:hypothetical protein
MERHDGSGAGTAEAPPIPDGFTAMQRTEKECQKLTHAPQQMLMQILC